MSFTCPHCGGEHDDSVEDCPASHRPITRAGKLVGSVIADKYKLLGLLGEGGMGAVYLAEHLQVSRRFALKRLHDRFAMDSHMAERFMREAKAAGKVGHRNIVEIYDIARDASGALFLVMELLDGKPLDAILRGRTLPVPVATAIMLQILSALGAAHAQGIVHRDMKPQNVFVASGPDGEPVVKVLDFGIAKVAQAETEQGLTATGDVVGTPHYMSPEQFMGSRDVDARADLYACGAILYRMIAGRLPHEADNVISLAYKISNEEPAPLGAVAGVPAALAEAVHKALSRDPAARFKDAGEFAAAMRPFAAGALGAADLAAVEARPTGDMGTQETMQSPAPAWSATAAASSAKGAGAGAGAARKPAWPWIALAGAGVIGIAVALAVLLPPALMGRPDRGLAAPPPGVPPGPDPRPVPPAAVEAGLARLTVVVDSPGAVVFLDGARIKGSPAEVKLRPTGESMLLAVRADGYEEYREWITLDKDLEVQVAMVALAKGKPGANEYSSVVEGAPVLAKDEAVGKVPPKAGKKSTGAGKEPGKPLPVESGSKEEAARDDGTEDTGEKSDEGNPMALVDAGKKKGEKKEAEAVAEQASGATDKAVLLKVIRKSNAAFKACHEKGLVKSPSLSGKVVVKFTIAATGKVTGAEAAQDTLGDAGVVSCILEEFGKLVFPPPEGGGIVVVSYPLVFMPAE